MIASYSTSSVTFRLKTEDIERLRQEAHFKGISLNSLMNHILKDYFDWYIFQSKVGFVPILKPVVEELFTKMSKEQIDQITANTANKESGNVIYFMKGRIDLDSFLSWFEARMKNSSIQVNHTLDKNTKMHTYVVKHDICENWSLYLKQIIEYVFNDILIRKVDVSTTYTTLTFRFKEEDY